MIDVTLSAVAPHAHGIYALRFVPAGAAPLPPVPAGAHIRIRLPGGMERSYSLVNNPGAAGHYDIAVHHDAAGAGGSRYLCEQARVGERFQITAPANHFGLFEAAVQGAPAGGAGDEAAGAAAGPAPSILIAGGIGITPLWSMIQRLEQTGGAWRLHYAARRRAAAAFLGELATLEGQAPGRLHLAFGDDVGHQRLDVAAIVAQAAPASHLYCCGPQRMLAEFKAATRSRDPATVHFEHFSVAPATAPAAGAGYTVELARSARSFFVPAGKTTLEVLMAEGFDVPYGCKQGICGACQTTVLDGVPEHHDMVLSDEERQSNQMAMICCSGCVGERLVLDL